MAGLQGRAFGGYQLAEELGAAGIAEVYRARPTKPGGREAVVKVIYPEFARQPGFLPHFRQIVQLTGKLASHPHILPMLGSGEEGGYLYLITPYVAGGTLNDWLARGGRMGPADIAPFFRQLCEALGYAHSLGVVHGNVKPSNVFLYEGRHVMLGDFGLLWDVAHMDVNQASSGGDALEYMAPEVAQGQVSPLSDVYSTGAVIFATIAGFPPFRGPRPADILAAHAQQPVPHLAQVNPALPPPLLALDAVTQRAMAKRPEQRFPSAAALAQSIETTIRQAAQAVPQSIPAPQAQPPLAAYMPPQLGAPPQWGQPGASATAIPPLGAGLGQAAAALFNAPPVPNGYEPQAPSIRPAGAQFPPLPSSASVDESMDRGGASFRQPELYQSGASSLAYEPTSRMPATPYSATPDPGGAFGQRDNADMENPGDAPADGAAQPLWQLGRARSGLGKRLGQPGAAPLGDPQAPFDGAEGYDGFSMPAVRGAGVDPAPPAPGFSLAGGPSGWIPPSVGDAEAGQPMSESRELQAWVGGGDPLSGGGDFGPVRSFSPTQLGLPRLTSPALGSMPPSWQDILSTPMSAVDDPRRWRPGGDDMGDRGLEVSMPHAHWRSNPDLDHEEWSEAPGEWVDPNSGPVGPMALGVQPRVSGGAAKKMPSWDEINRAPSEDDLRFDSRLARKSRLRLRGRSRFVPRLMLVLVLLSILDLGAVVIARPDLCPVSACVLISNKVHQALPFLHSKPPTPAVAHATPASVEISVVTEKTATATITLANATSTSLDWQASASLPWLTIAPVSGTLGVGNSVSLTASANATNITPKSYKATITVTTPHGNVTIPVTITVTAPSTATSTPTAFQIIPGGSI